MNAYIDTALDEAELFYPRLLINDYVRTATMTASNGTPDSVRSPQTYSRWIADDATPFIAAEFLAPQTIDYIAAYVVANDSADFTAEYYDGATWTAIPGTLARTGPGCILWLFEPIEDVEDIRITPDADCEIAVIKAGLSTIIPVGHQVGYRPSLYNLRETLTNTVSVKGTILGSNIEAVRVADSLSFDLLEPEWVEDDFMPLRAQFRSVGVFHVWCPKDYPGQVVYGMVTGDPQVSFSNVNTMAVSMELEGPPHEL